MASWSLHFLKVTGRLARDVESALEAVRRRHVDESGRCEISFLRRETRRLEHIAMALLSTADSLPVIWHSQYVDGYTFADYGTVRWSPQMCRRITGMGLNVSYFGPAEIPAAAQILKKRKLRDSYVNHLRAAIEGIDWAEGKPLVVVIAQCLGPSREDDAVNAAGNTSLRSLLRATRDQIPVLPDGRRPAGLHRRLTRLAKKLADENLRSTSE